MKPYEKGIAVPIAIQSWNDRLGTIGRALGFTLLFFLLLGFCTLTLMRKPVWLSIHREARLRDAEAISINLANHDFQTHDGLTVKLQSVNLNNGTNESSVGDTIGALHSPDNGTVSQASVGVDGVHAGGFMHPDGAAAGERPGGNRTNAIQKSFDVSNAYPIGNYTFIGLDVIYGRTCNSLKSIATVVYRANQEAHGVALSAYYSHVLNDTGLDIVAFTAFNPSVPLLLDCAFRQKNIEASCRRRYQNGTLIETTVEVKVVRMVIGEDAFSDMLHTVEVMNVMLKYRLPRADEEMVDGVLDRLRATSKSRIIVGVHRRALEGLCYKWLVNFVHVPPYGTHELFQKGGRCNGVTENGLGMDGSTERCYREVSMLYSLCNFTLSNDEVTFVRQVSGWGDFIELKDYGLLLATDKQVPRGDVAIKRSAPVAFQLVDHLPKAYSESRLLLREMYALSRADYFVSQPLSSCDWIVQYWRVRRWNMSVNSTFPPNQIFKYFSGVQ